MTVRVSLYVYFFLSLAFSVGTNELACLNNQLTDDLASLFEVRDDNCQQYIEKKEEKEKKLFIELIMITI